MRTRSMLPIAGALLVAACLVAVPTASPALAVPAGFADSLVGSFTQPTAVKVLPGGDLLVLEKGGTFQRVAANGSISAAGTIDVCSGNDERGLLSAALDPTFATTGTIYVYATRPARRRVHQHALEVHDERRGRSARIRAGTDRQHRLDGHQSQRRHRRGRPRRFPLPQRG